MPARPGLSSQESYPSPSASAGTHSDDPFGSAHAHGRRQYYDNDSDHIDYARRDGYRETYGSDGSNPALNDPSYYDNNNQFEGYREFTFSPTASFLSPFNGFDCNAAPQDTDSDSGDVYARHHTGASTEFLGQPVPRPGYDSSTPTFLDPGMPQGSRDAYPSWIPENNIPLSKEEIEDIFLDLTQKFGFQRDSMRNIVRWLFPHPIGVPALHDFLL